MMMLASAPKNHNNNNNNYHFSSIKVNNLLPGHFGELSLVSMASDSDDLYVESAICTGGCRYVLLTPKPQQKDTMMACLAGIAIDEAALGRPNPAGFSDVFLTLADIVPFSTRSGQRFTITFEIRYNDWRFARVETFSEVFTSLSA